MREMLKSFRGAYPVTTEQLAQTRDPDTLASSWVVFTADEVVDTNLGTVVTSFGRKDDPLRETKTTTQNKYVLARAKDRWIIAEVPLDFSGKRFKGTLQPWTNGLRKEAVDKITRDHPQRALQPYQMECVEPGGVTGWLLLGGAGLILLAGIALFLKGAFSLWVAHRNRPAPIRKNKRAARTSE
jgi:hypothetical protein